MSDITPFRDPLAERWQDLAAEIEQQVREYFFPVTMPQPKPDNRYLIVLTGI